MSQTEDLDLLRTQILREVGHMAHHLDLAPPTEVVLGDSPAHMSRLWTSHVHACVKAQKTNLFVSRLRQDPVTYDTDPEMEFIDRALMSDIGLSFRSWPYERMTLRLRQLCVSIIWTTTTVYALRRPAVLRAENQQLHCDHGPAVIWHDKTSERFLFGVRIPLVLHNQLIYGRLKMHQISNILNTEVQAAVIQQIGWDKMIQDPSVKVETLDHDDRWGTLRRVTIARKSNKNRLWDRERIWMLLEVVNRSPEPDGSFRHYWLTVDPSLRPLVLPSEQTRFVRPFRVIAQELTSLNAVASTFGMVGKEYAAMLGAES